jgi:predicted aspartyl protease
VIAAALLAATALRFVVMHVDVNAYGVPGKGTIVVDRATGHFVRRFSAGPASEQEGWDGSHAWRADATGLARVEGNAGERAEIVAWSSALTRAIDAPPHRVRVAGTSDHIDITFEAYRRISGLSVPGRIVASSAQNGVWTTTLRTAATPASVPVTTFAAPAPPASDASLAHVTRIPVAMDIGSPVVDVTVNGNRLHFLLDTGGQNVITTDAARIAGLAVVGHGVVGGGGGGTAPIRYTFADSVRVGAAVLRHQPFIVLPANALPPVDGIVGYELLARFAARLDMAHLTLELAPDVAAFGRPVAPARFAYDDRQPQVAGALDATRGAFTIDTGSSLTAQVPEPVVRAQRLVARMHATVSAYANDVGGRYRIYIVRADVLRLGSAAFERPLVDLLTKTDHSTPTTIANVGDGILRRWILVFDYPHQTIDFRPGGDPAGNVVHDRSGLILTARSGGVVVGQVLTGTPAAQAGIIESARIVAVDGVPVTGSDLVRVRNLLRGAPGTKVRLQLADGSTRIITLQRYL